MIRAVPRSIGIAAAVLALASLGPAPPAARADKLDDLLKKDRPKWVASWTTAPQTTFKGSNAPALVNFAFPFTAPALPQAHNQTLRMIVKPDLWASIMRIRLTNTWGTNAITFGRVAVGLQ